ASAAVVDHVAANIILVDSAAGSPTPSIDDFLTALTPRTKAVITVDIGGVPYPSDRLRDALATTKFTPASDMQAALGRPAVITDAAHSLGAVRNHQNSGSLGDFTAFSFHAVKNLTTAEGGALTWRSDLPAEQAAMAAKIRRLALHGQSKDALAKSRAGAWDYDVVELGYKLNMPDTLAALGLSQLSRYDASLRRRHELISIYTSASPNVEFMPHDGPGMKSSAHLCITRLPSHRTDERDKIIGDLGTQGIAANVHYKPLPLMTAYQRHGHTIASTPNAMDYYRSEVTLPLFTSMTDEQAEYVIDRYSRLVMP
ncbi:DegT/DnrJ/EryC1/StrS family aminotransferase, partial [Ornithinimicrobium kibberense]